MKCRNLIEKLRVFLLVGYHGELKVNLFDYILSRRVHKPQKVYTFSSIVGNIIPKSVKCIHSATKYNYP